MSKTKICSLRKNQLRQEARDKECQIRSPFCNGDPATTVLCHLNSGGMGMKVDDWLGAWGCSGCHDLVDGRTPTDTLDYAILKLYHLEGVHRTQLELLNMGYEIGFRT